MDNALTVYNALRRPPSDALREIKGGRLSGFTDIKPQWRIEAMTKSFGLCGIGWKFTVDRKWTEQGVDGEVFAFVDVSLYIKDGTAWSDAIPATGGSMLIAKERSGLHGSDEAYKMATTDALGVAMSRIGVAADIYMGRWDGSKYHDTEDDIAALSDPKDSKGNYAPDVPAGEIAPKGNGLRSEMLEMRTRFFSLAEMKDDEGSPVFSSDDKKDMNADYHPGGKNLEPSEEHKKYFADIIEKWETKGKLIIENRRQLDRELEDGFNTALDKVD